MQAEQMKYKFKKLNEYTNTTEKWTGQKEWSTGC